MTVTDSNGCTATASKTLTIHPVPMVTIDGQDRICEGETTVFTASGGETYRWSSNETTATISVGDGTERIVTVTDTNGCSATASKRLIVDEQPNAGPDQSVDCFERDQALLNASGSGSWSLDPSSAGMVTISDLTSANATLSGWTLPGVYIMIWSNGQCEDRITITVNDNCDCPSGDNSINPPSVNEACGRFTSVTLTGNAASPAGGNYSWEADINNTGFVPASGMNTLQNYVTGDLSTGTYRFRRVYTVTANGNVCIYTGNIIDIVVYQKPTASVAGDDTVCEGTPAFFTAAGGQSYRWNTGETTATIQVTNTTTRIVTVTDNNGCTDTASKTLVIFNNPQGAITGTNAICEGQTAAFTASGGQTYRWSTGETTSVINVSSDNTYSVTVTDTNGCTDVVSKTLTVHSLPQAAISGNDAVCEGDIATFTASGGNSYRWNTGETTAEITVTDDNARIVTVTNSNGCQDTASKTLTIRDLPEAGSDKFLLCYKNGEVFMDAIGTGSWSAGQGNPSAAIIANSNSNTTLVFGFTKPGTYRFIWSDGFCEDEVIVNVENQCPCDKLNTEIFPLFCDLVSDIVINGNIPAQGGKFVWEYSYNGNTFLPAPGINDGANYITGSLELGDHSFRRLFIFENEDLTSCTDTSNIVVLQVLNAISKEFDIEIQPNPVCAGDTMLVHVNGFTPASYDWNLISDGASIQSFPDYAVIIPQREGVFRFTVTQTTEFCQFVSEPKVFEFSVFPSPRVSIGRDTIICDQDGGFELKIKDDFVDITWNDGSKANTLFVEESGIYSVQVKDENGCDATDQIVIRDFCCKVFYPNIIKLTAENYNNRLFQIKESGCVVSSELWIYDRWGNLVYKSEDVLAPWDGTFKNDFVQQGVYTFIFSYKALDENKNEFSEKLSGDITIVE